MPTFIGEYLTEVPQTSACLNSFRIDLCLQPVRASVATSDRKPQSAPRPARRAHSVERNRGFLSFFLLFRTAREARCAGPGDVAAHHHNDIAVLSQRHHSGITAASPRHHSGDGREVCEMDEELMPKLPDRLLQKSSTLVCAPGNTTGCS